MTAIPRKVGAITLFVGDVSRSKSFYQNVFDASVIFEDESSAVFAFGDTVVNVLDISEAHSLMDPAVVAAPGTGSRFLLSIWVDDVDAIVAELARRGVPLVNGPVDREWGKRTASFADPDGTVWEIAQDIDTAESG